MVHVGDTFLVPNLLEMSQDVYWGLSGQIDVWTCMQDLPVSFLPGQVGTQ